MSQNGGIILFDGDCHICHAAVQFILKHEKEPYYRFASLQSEKGASFIKAFELPDNLDSMVVIEDEQAFIYSDAVLKMIPNLSRRWQIGRMLWILPKPIRDQLYRFVAKNRYRLTRAEEACRLPSSAEQKRFLL